MQGIFFRDIRLLKALLFKAPASGVNPVQDHAHN
jgi:hypothetical protein